MQPLLARWEPILDVKAEGFLTGWRHYRGQLNRLPVSRTNWDN